MKLIILAGGSGFRLYPVSREKEPKQFVDIQDVPMIINTIYRFCNVFELKDIFIITSSEYKEKMKELLKEHDLTIGKVLCEPTQKNTLSAIGFCIKYFIEQLRCTEDETIFITPSDLIMKNIDCIKHKSIKKIVDNKILVFGLKPKNPNQNYGYILTSNCNDGLFEVESFVEKPNKQQLIELLYTCKAYWNSGMYCMNIKTFMDEIEYNATKLHEFVINLDAKQSIEQFHDLENISIDHGISEKCNNMVMIEIYDWCDAGSWENMYEYRDKDINGNIHSKYSILHNCTNVMVKSDKMVVGIDLNDLVVVEHDDVVFVSKLGSSSKIKDIKDMIPTQFK